MPDTDKSQYFVLGKYIFWISDCKKLHSNTMPYLQFCLGFCREVTNSQEEKLHLDIWWVHNVNIARTPIYPTATLTKVYNPPTLGKLLKIHFWLYQWNFCSLDILCMIKHLTRLCGRKFFLSLTFPLVLVAFFLCSTKRYAVTKYPAVGHGLK